VKARFEPVFEKLKTMEGVNVIGNVPQAELARAFLSAEILCYPNTFAETSCITAMEAQAAGCVPVTSALAALKETVADTGVLVSETPGSPEYIDAYVDAVCGLLSNPDQLTSLSTAGRTRASREHSWLHVAERLELYLAETFKLV
jgi:glycosyltransferase involved in cell wall biosynthesis